MTTFRSTRHDNGERLPMADGCFDVAAIQPCEPTDERSLASVQAKAWDAVRTVALQGVRLIVLPEYFNVMGVPEDQFHLATSRTAPLHGQAREICRRYGVWLLLPLAERRGNSVYNSAHLYDSSGQIVFTYDKTHLTETELENCGMTPGERIGVVRTPLGCIGVMTCFDIYVPEMAQTLAQEGSQIILFPSLQRSDTPERCMLLARARAIDTSCYIVRAAYGQREEAAAKNACYGQSCVIAPDGTVLANADRYAPSAIASVDLNRPWSRASCYGKPEEPVRDFLGRARRPHLYRRLTDAVAGAQDVVDRCANAPSPDKQS